MALELPDTFQRLPVYIIIDTSGSMDGAPITAVNEGLQMFEQIIRDDPQCRETAFVSIICFASDADVAVPLTEAESFRAPSFTAGGGTALSKALRKLLESIRADMKPKSEDYPGDYKPLVFLMTDGKPNSGDGWKKTAEELFSQKGRRPALIVSIGVGPQADANMLRQLSPESTYMLADLDPTKIKELFVWMANSTVRASRPESHQAGVGAEQVLAEAPPNLFEQEN